MIALLDRATRLAARLAIGLLFAAGGASAEPFSFATTPGKLPKAVVPVHYSLDLKPDFQKLTLAGSEVVDIEVREPTDRLVLNAVNMTVSAAAIDGIGAAANISHDARAETVTFAFASVIPAGRHNLRVEFAAHINRFGRGLFVVDYPAGEGRKRMISSHCEPADCRRIFPGWDEPAFKASFDLTVTVPQDYLAVTNTPPVKEEVAGEGLKRVSFAPTPRMSTYLFVLIAGELERITADADGVSVGVVTTRGKSEGGRYALAETVAMLKYFNEYFDSKYPLAKLDLVAVPGGFGGAMENWGAITFFESRLLFDPARNARDAQRGIFSILAHEVAHQWFGNLVTTAWWDNLWLNEGFASWMQNKAAEHLHPDWQVWVNSGFKQAAMAEDARRTTHPIQQPVANESEAMAVFDVITYSKGQSFIRMLENYLGETAFRAGIRQFMRDHAYSNATTADMWRALEAASGKPVAPVAAAYTEQGGVPMIDVGVRCVDGEQRITLRQGRYAVNDPDAKPQRWQVPVAYGPLRAVPAPSILLLDGATEIKGGACDEPVKLNLGDVGYYRVRYDAAALAALTRAFDAMTPADRINLLSDTWAMIEAGHAAPDAFFGLVEQLNGDEPRAVWEQVLRTFGRIDHLERGRPGRAVFQAYTRARLRPVFDRVGWTAAAGEPAERTVLRGRLVRTLGDFGDEAVIAEAKRRFADYVRDPASLAPDLRESVTHLVGRTADRATFDLLLGLGRKSNATDERVRYYSAAAGALDPALAREALAIALTDELTNSMVSTLILWVAAEHRELTWDFVRENFTALASKQSPAYRSTVASYLLAGFTERSRAAELAAFAPANETSGGRIVSARTQERILADAEFAERQLPAIDEWIRRNGLRP